MTRRVLRAGRTATLAGSIGFAGYASGIHDALTDPEGQTKKMLAKVLASHTSGSGVLEADAADALLVTRLGNELVIAAQEALSMEVEKLKGDELLTLIDVREE